MQKGNLKKIGGFAQVHLLAPGRPESGLRGANTVDIYRMSFLND